MARENATSVVARAGTMQGLARSVAHPAYERLTKLEPWLTRAIPVLIVVFLGTLVAGAVVYARQMGKPHTMSVLGRVSRGHEEARLV